MDNGKIFGFESGYAQDLHFVPIAMRYRLDLAGLKIGLEAWLKIPVARRFYLAAFPIATGDGTAAFALEAGRAHCEAVGTEPATVPRSDPETWSGALPPPEPVVVACRDNGNPMESAQWRQMTDLQRYALLKLSLSRRNPEAFGMAWREFSENRT